LHTNVRAQYYPNCIAHYLHNAEEVNSNSTAASTDEIDITDPLADSSACKRDIAQLKKLQTNTIRVYAIDPKKDHEDCMTQLADAGIYVVADLSEPGMSINRDDPGWTVELYARYTSVVDEMMKYDNTLGFFAGNEVSNQPNNTVASAFVKAAVRDTKAYIKSKNYREIGVGYATNDDADIRENMANYFDCGDSDSAIDFWGYNIYSWCGDSSFTESGFDVQTKNFEKYNVPVFFAEYGCNTPRPRKFTEVKALYGDDMTGVWSGGIVYMYFEEENEFGKFLLFPMYRFASNSCQVSLPSRMARLRPTRTLTTCPSRSPRPLPSVSRCPSTSPATPLPPHAPRSLLASGKPSLTPSLLSPTPTSARA
jgi:hypothetical protein